MSYTKQIYKPYRVINNVEYFRVGTVADIVGKSRQTIQLWDSYSDSLEDQNKSRLIPKSTRIGQNGIRCWNEDEIDMIVTFSKGIKYGDLSVFSRTRWGERGDNLRQDRSSDGKKARQQYRNTVNIVAKKLQKQQKVKQIKIARKDMLQTVRRRAKNIYGDIKY